MKGDIKLIEKLNFLLADELAAINQYIVHAEMCEDWGYTKLHSNFERRAIVEMKHAEKLIGRILFLEGIPKVDTLSPIHIGSTVDKMLAYDHEAELRAVKAYNEAIVLAAEVNDYATRDILQEILNDEDHHVDELEELNDQVDQMTLPLFLTTQTENNK